MKWISCILAIYLLALSVLPCSDGDGPMEDVAYALMSAGNTADDGHEHNNDCEDDDCSPFCICSCCSLALDTPAKVTDLQQKPGPVPGDAPAGIPNLFSSSLGHSIWQPPRYG